MKKYKIGYTQGTFDMFHIGHLNLLHQAKELCEELNVGVNTDLLVSDYKHKQPVVSERDLKPLGAKVVYLQHTEGISSTLLRVEAGNRVCDGNEENTPQDYHYDR